MNSNVSEWTRRDIAHRIVTGSIFAVLAGCLFLLFRVPGPVTMYDSPLVGLMAPAVVTCATYLLRFRSRIGYVVGLCGTIAAWWHFLSRELWVWGYSWLVFNGPDEIVKFYPDRFLNLVTAIVLIFATMIALQGFVPKHWTVKGTPVAYRPSFALLLGVIVVTVWYLTSVTRDRLVATDVRSVPVGQIEIIHLQRDGIHFRDSFISTSMDGKVDFGKTERHWFQYGFRQILSDAPEPANYQSLLPIVQSAEFSALPEVRLQRPKGWKYDYWFISAERGRPRSTATLDKSVLPRQLVELVERTENGIPQQSRTTTIHDVCFGLCYSPVW